VLIFIDESGDAGFNIAKGSSQNFVVVCVIFDDPLDAEETAVRIKRLKRELGKSDDFEFKFNGCSRDYRTAFFEKVASCSFKYRAIIMDKDRIYGPELRRSKDSFYNFTVKNVLKHSSGSIRDAKVVIDGAGSREFKRTMGAYLRKMVNERSSIIKELKFKNSRNNVLLQLADMVAGAVHRSCTAKSDASVYRALIKQREEDVWMFGG
jgi:hypothetical protein